MLLLSEIYVTDYASRLAHVALYAWMLLHPRTTLAPLCKRNGIPWTTHQALSIFLTIIAMKEEYGDEGIGPYMTDLIESVGPANIVRAFQGALADETLMTSNALFALLETVECVIRAGDSRIDEACAQYNLLIPLHESLARYLDSQYELDAMARGRQERVLNILIANKVAPLLEYASRLVMLVRGGSCCYISRQVLRSRSVQKNDIARAGPCANDMAYFGIHAGHRHGSRRAQDQSAG